MCLYLGLYIVFVLVRTSAFMRVCLYTNHNLRVMYVFKNMDVYKCCM